VTAGAAVRGKAWRPLAPPVPDFLSGLISSRSGQLLVCAFMGLILRAAAFGDPAIHIDEAFYFLVGIKMHEGFLPYVDIWDRKPFGLFALFYLMAGISRSVLSYQVLAWACASLTAFLIARLSLRWVSPTNALLAAACYQAGLVTFQGIGGQSPLFYNLLMVASAWLVIRSLPSLREGRTPAGTYVAMFLCGVAITMKQTTVFEAATFGLFVTYVLWSAEKDLQRVAPRASLFILAGAAPFCAIGLYYAVHGAWPEFWQAMVGSNLTKGSATLPQYVGRAVRLLVEIICFVFAAAIGLKLLKQTSEDRHVKAFLPLWLAAAVIGYFSVPNLYPHYALPVLPPLCLLAAIAFQNAAIGRALAVFPILSAFYLHSVDFQRHRQNAVEMERMAAVLREQTPRGTLLVFDAPPMLYALADLAPLSPLVFPNHLNHEIERDVSHLKTSEEMRRILAARPGSVVLSTKPRVKLFNRESWSLVKDYTRQRCTFATRATIREIGRRDTIAVYTNCG
jgi:hypothetical protein